MNHIQRRLQHFSPTQLALNPVSYGRLVIGEIELPRDSDEHRELIRRLDNLERQVGRHDARDA